MRTSWPGGEQDVIGSMRRPLGSRPGTGRVITACAGHLCSGPGRTEERMYPMRTSNRRALSARAAAGTVTLAGLAGASAAAAPAAEAVSARPPAVDLANHLLDQGKEVSL